jgi:hypothetical protein
MGLSKSLEIAMKASIIEDFAILEAPRLERKLHALKDMMMLVICGVVSGAEGSLPLS